ncbi:MAG: hypothetical protein WCV67_20560 [Victivallaceae bacterium]
MIKLADSSIMLIGPDGMLNVFESEKLQSKIIRSFMLAGVRDIWLAEDITLAVEYALEQDSREDKVFAVSEINSTVIKILEDSGFPEAAESYRRGNPCTEITLNAETATVAGLVNRHLGLKGRSLDALVAKVVQAAGKLDINAASPALYIELAKHFKSEFMPADSLPQIMRSKSQNASPWVVSIKELTDKMSASSRSLIRDKIISLSGVSRLFPAVKVIFKISGLVEMHHLESPLTEMAMVSHFDSIAQALNESISATQSIFRAKGELLPEKGLPVILTVPDMSAFAQNNLEASWPQASADCREMLSYLERMVNTPVFKVKMT